MDKPLSVIIAVAMGCACMAAEPREDQSWSEGNAVRLDLKLVAMPTNDLQAVQLKLTLTNTGKKDLVLDNELVAGFVLQFKTDLSEEFVRSDDRDVSSVHVEEVKRPDTAENLKRFVTIRPGQSFSRLYDLSKPLKVECEGHSTTFPNMLHHGFYYEEVVRYQVPVKARQLRVCAWLDRVSMFSGRQFEAWHGVNAEKLGLWQGRARSNTLIVDKKP